MSEKKRKMKNREEAEKKAISQSKCKEMRSFLGGDLSLGSQEDSEGHSTMWIQSNTLKLY